MAKDGQALPSTTFMKKNFELDTYSKTKFVLRQ